MLAKDLKVGMKVVVHECGVKFVYKLTSVQHFPQLGEKFGAAFVALGTEEWDHGVLGLGSTLPLDEEIEIED